MGRKNWYCIFPLLTFLLIFNYNIHIKIYTKNWTWYSDIILIEKFIIHISAYTWNWFSQHKIWVVHILLCTKFLSFKVWYLIFVITWTFIFKTTIFHWQFLYKTILICIESLCYKIDPWIKLLAHIQFIVGHTKDSIALS